MDFVGNTPVGEDTPVSPEGGGNIGPRTENPTIDPSLEITQKLSGDMMSPNSDFSGDIVPLQIRERKRKFPKGHQLTYFKVDFR